MPLGMQDQRRVRLSSPLSAGQDTGVWWSGTLGCCWGDVQRILLYLFEGNLSVVIVWQGVSGG